MHIGEVAEQTGLSLRTIRYYEEVGLVVPSGRSPGGFRLYRAAEVERLLVVKQMKPLELTLEEMRDLLAVLDSLATAPPGEPGTGALLDRLAMYREAAETRVAALRRQLEVAESFAATLRQRLAARPAAAAEPTIPGSPE